MFLTCQRPERENIQGIRDLMYNEIIAEMAGGGAPQSVALYIYGSSMRKRIFFQAIATK